MNYSTHLSKISKQLSCEITNFFSKQEIEQCARESGFIQRSGGKLTGYEFAEALLIEQSDLKEQSLNDISNSLLFHHQLVIRKQSIDERFGPKSVLFFKTLLKCFLKKMVKGSSCTQDMFSGFNSVRIKDSTCFQLPDIFKDEYAGSGGCASKAMLRIQFEYDYKTGQVFELEVYAFNKQDKTNAKDTIDNINQGDLLVRDLGYISISALSAIENKQAYYLNRLDSQTGAWTKKKDGSFELIDFGKLTKRMEQQQIPVTDIEVYLGAEKSLKVRLVAELLPHQIVEQRIAKAQREAKKKGRTLSSTYKDRAGLNLFITNVSTEVLPTTKVRELYRLRWQIELVFKAWKSIGKLQNVRKMKLDRYKTSLWARLLLIMLNWKIIIELSQIMWVNSKKWVSHYKAFKVLTQQKQILRAALRESEHKVQQMFDDLMKLAHKNLVIENKKGNLSSLDIILMKITT